MASRMLALAAAGALALSLGACGNAPAAQPADDAAASSTADASATTAPAFDGDQYADTGEGTAYLVTSDGTTKDGAVPKMGVNPSIREVEVSIVTEGLAQKSPLYVYVDGKLVDDEDDVNSSASIELEDSALTKGEHSIEFVQFDNGTPQGTVVFYRVGRYSVE